MTPSRTFAEFLGQARIVSLVIMLLTGEMKLGRVFKGMILAGPSGVGKTLFAECVASHLKGAFFLLRCGPDFTVKDSLVPILQAIKSGDVFFIDEAHAFPHRIYEQLYRCIDEQGEVRLSEFLGGKKLPEGEDTLIPKFTLVLATNYPDKLPPALQNRLEHVLFDHYSEAEICDILRAYFGRGNVTFTPQVVPKIAAISKGLPRNAIKHADNLQRQAAAINQTSITTAVFKRYIHKKGIHEETGFDRTDILYMKTLYEQNKKVSIGMIGNITNVPEEILKRTVEPHLARIGFVDRDRGGRILMEPGRRCIESILQCEQARGPISFSDDQQQPEEDSDDSCTDGGTVDQVDNSGV